MKDPTSRRPVVTVRITLLTILLCVGFTAAAQDSTPPLVTITSPANGAIISSDLGSISGTASDTETGISSVRFMLWYLANPCTPGPSGQMCYLIWRTSAAGATEWFPSDELDSITEPTDNGSPTWTSIANLPLMEDMVDGQEYFILAQANNAGTPQLLNRVFSSFTFLSPDGDQTAPIIGTVYSVAGNPTSSQGPGGFLSGDSTDDGTTAIHISVHDNASGVAGVRWSDVDQPYSSMANACSLGPTGEAACNATLVGIGLHTVYLRAIDVAGNETPSSTIVSYSIDPSPPSALTILSVAGVIAPPYIDPTDDRITVVAFTVSDAVSSIRAVSFGTTDGSPGSLPYACGSLSSCTLQFQGAGPHRVYMRAIDMAGNASPTATIDYTIDGTPPSNVVITSVAGLMAPPYIDESDDGTTMITISTSDVGTGVTGVRWGQADQVYSSLPFTCSSTSSCDVTLSGAGPRTVYIRAIDGAGNTSISATRVDYTITSPPPATVVASISIATPSNGVITTPPSTIAGGVSNASSVTFTYHDLTSGSYWNGTTWQAGSARLRAQISNGSWTSSVPLPLKLTSQRRYRITATAQGENSATSTLTFTFSARTRAVRR